MAATSMTPLPLFLSLLVVEHWSKMLSMSARDTTPIAPLWGEDQNSIIPVKTKTKKDKGDTITFSLPDRLQDEGIDHQRISEGLNSSAVWRPLGQTVLKLAGVK